MKTNSRSAKTPQHQSKKVEEQKVTIKSEGDDIKDAFELFDANYEKLILGKLEQQCKI